MDKVQELVDSLATAITVPETGDARPLLTAANPIYDCEQKLTERWQWRAPARLPVPLGPVDLGFMVRTIDYDAATQQAETLASAQLLSNTLNQQRQAIDASADTKDHLLVYLHLLKELGGECFDNTNVKWRAYFPGAQRSSSNVHGEYLQGLVLLAQRTYTASLDLPDGGGRAVLLDECAAAMHEACETAQLLQSERYDQERQQRWQYVKSPKSLSPDSVQDSQTRIDEFRREDTRQLRAFIREEMGGLAQLGAHTLLMRLQKNEMRARLIEADVRQKGLAAEHQNVETVLAPVIQAVMDDYESIMVQLSQKQEARLALYSQHMRLYWHTRQQLLLAQADYAVYEAAEQENALDYGKRALRRIKALEHHSPEDHEAVQQLYEKATTELEGLYGAGSTLEMPVIEPYQATSATPLFATQREQAWQRFTQKNRDVALALEHMQALCRRRASDVVTNTSDNGTMIEQTRSFPLTNAAKAALLQDRQRHLRWLLGMRQPPETTITLSAEVVTQMGVELAKVEQVMQEERLVY